MPLCQTDMSSWNIARLWI